MVRVCDEAARRYRGGRPQSAPVQARRPTRPVELAGAAFAFLFFSASLASFAQYAMTLRSLQELATDAAQRSILGAVPSERDALARAYVARAVAGSDMLRGDSIRVATGMSGLPTMRYEVTLTYDLRHTPAAFIGRLLLLPVRSLSWTATVSAAEF